MSYFAEISGSNNIVTRVIAAEQDFVNSIGGTWIQTSPNRPLRKNYAGMDFTYDESRDAFIPPQPEPSASIVNGVSNSTPYILNEDTCIWEVSGSN